MTTFKLERNVELYRAQFEKFSQEFFGDYRLDRYSLELDSILFKMKYMEMRNLITDEDIPKLKKEFTAKAVQLREAFGELIIQFVMEFLQVPDRFTENDIEDILVMDVRMDPIYVHFRIIVISPDEEFLQYLDKSIPVDTLDMYPDEYFRFHTDSYNDGIAKAYPELFENRHVDIGKGDDGDVFVHSFSFQTNEDCNLCCSYCLSGDTLVRMADGSQLPIQYIRVGDKVLSVPENISSMDSSNLVPATVIGVSKRYDYTVGFGIKGEDELRVTTNHPFLTSQFKFLSPFDMLIEDREYHRTPELVLYNDSSKSLEKVSFKDIDIHANFKGSDVYNLETSTHTYIAGKYVVHNCYQQHKTPMHMEFSTAKKFIDHLLNDDYSYINRYNSPAIILEFIGGEPFLQIKLIRQIYEYFLDRCYELNHPWFSLHRVSICSNGIAYFDPDVQALFKDYSSQISFNISIDGNKDLHDSCRVDREGKGSYDRAMKALNHFNANFSPERNSKMTLAPQNISYLYESVVDFIKNGMKVININCVFEEGWTPETARTEYLQLCMISEYLLENNLEHIYIAIFNDRQEGPYEKSFNGTSCGGNGSMLAMRPNGQFYPCLRYMPSSVGNNVRDLCIGDVDNGLVGRTEDSEVLQLLDSITRRSQNNDICYECPLANDCPSCLAHGHTVFDTPDKRATFICIQVIAEALANVYHWNRMALKHPEWEITPRENVVPDEWARLILSEEELSELKNYEALAKKEWVR